MALQPDIPDPLFPGNTPSTDPNTPLVPSNARTIRRRDRDTIGARLHEMGGLIANARRHAARGDVESANKYVNEIESFIDDNQVALENLANATHIRSEDAREQQASAVKLLEGAYLRENMRTQANGQEVDIPLSTLLNAEQNPAYETFSALKRARNLGNETLEQLTVGDPELTATSVLYQQTVGLQPTFAGLVPGADAYDKQMFFATQVERLKNGALGDLTDESLAQVMREVLQSGDSDRAMSLDQMCDVFDNILGMAGGDYSARGISDAASRFRAYRSKALVGEDGKPVPDDGTTSDLMTAARQLSEASWGVGDDSVVPSADLFGIALEDKGLLQEYNALRDHGAFRGMSKSEKEATLRALVARHAAQTLGPGLGVLDDYAESSVSRGLQTLQMTFDAVQDEFSKFVPPLQDPKNPDELLDPTEAQSFLAEPVSVLTDSLKSYLAEKSRSQVFTTTTQALTALYDDPAAAATLSQALQLNTSLDRRVCDALASEYLLELKEVYESGGLASFDPNEFYKRFTSTDESELHREVQEEDEKLEGIAARIQQGMALTDSEARLWSASRDRDAGLPIDELDKFTDTGDFTQLGVEMDTTYREIELGYFGSPEVLAAVGARTVSSSAYQSVISKVQKGIADANGDPAAAQKVLDAFLNGDAGYQLSFPHVASNFGGSDELTLATVFGQISASDPELVSLTVQALVSGDPDAAASALSSLYQVYVTEYAPVTHPDAIQKYTTIYTNSFSRDLAQIKHTLAERRTNGSLPDDIPADAEHRLDQALRTVLDFEKERQRRAGTAGAKAHETLNFSALDNMVGAPGEMTAVNLAVSHALYYGDEKQKAAARDAIYNLTAIYYGKEAAQTAVDNTMFAGLGADLFNKITEIRSAANKAHAQSAADSRSRQGTFDTTLLVADVLTLGGKAVATGLTKKAVSQGAAATAKKATRVAGAKGGRASAASVASQPWYKNAVHGFWDSAKAAGAVTSKTAAALMAPAFNRTSAYAMGSMATAGLSLALSPGVTPYTPVNNSGVVADRYDSFGTTEGAVYDAQANALQATEDTADASSYGFLSGAATTGSASLTGAGVGSAFCPGIGTAIGAGVGAVVGLGVVLYDVFDASSDTEQIEQTEKQRILDLMVETINDLQNNPQVSDDCKANLARAISDQKISGQMSVDEKGQAYLRALQSFAGTMKTRFEMDARNAAKNLGGLFTAADETVRVDRMIARGEAQGAMYSTATKGGRRKSSDEAHFFRRALAAQKPGLVVHKDRAAINKAATAVMAQVGRDISADDPVLRNMVNAQLIDWTKEYNEIVKTGKTRGLESSLQVYLINRASQEGLGAGLRQLNLQQRREEAMAKHIPSEGKSLEQLQQEQQIKLNADIAKGMADLERKKEYTAWVKETYPDD